MQALKGSAFTAGELSRMLASRAEEVARMLLPAGKRVSGEWCAGDVSGSSGKSLKVHLQGTKAGVWADFAGEDKGDLLDLWCKSRGKRLVEILPEVRTFLNLPDEEPRKTYKPVKIKLTPLDKANRAVWHYLTLTRRIDPGILTKFKIAVRHRDARMWVGLPFCDRVGKEIVLLKWISWGREKKYVTCEPGGAPSLFGWQHIPDNVRSLTIVEGEIDCMSWACYGVRAVSIPFGAGEGTSHAWIEHEWENLRQFDTIWISFDMDKVGRAAAAEVARRLGLHRCRLVELPRKDANECLMAKVPRETMMAALTNAKAIEPEHWTTPKDFIEQTARHLWPTEADKQASCFCPSFTDANLQFRMGELTLWTGVAGEGKSTALNQLILEAVIHDQRVAICSPEMHGSRLLAKWLRQFCATREFDRNDLDHLAHWLSEDRLWIVDMQGKVSPDPLLQAFTYGRQRYNIRHFVIDSLMKLRINGDDYNAQNDFMNELMEFARSNEVHVHLVAHPRKPPEDRGKIVGKQDVRGSGTITDQADNIVSVWRNHRKEDDRHDGKQVNDTNPDTVLKVQKQRETGWEGKYKLWFDGASETFRNDQTKMPTDYRKWTLFGQAATS